MLQKVLSLILLVVMIVLARLKLGEDIMTFFISDNL